MRPQCGIGLKNSYEEYFAGLSKHTRQNIRTAYNRLNTDGRTYSMEIWRDKKIPRRLMNQLLDRMYERKISEYGISVNRLKLAYIKNIDFQTAYQRTWKDNYCAIFRVDGEIAAFLLGVISGASLLVPRLAINEEFERYSPGILMLNELAKTFDESQEIRFIDLQSGAEPYKLTMGGQVYNHYVLTYEKE